MTGLSERIHPTAVISERARLAADVTVGPYTVIGPDVSIGEGTTVSPHVVMTGAVEIGSRCQIFPGCCIGTPPQDRRSVAAGRVLIGDDNVLREYVTIHASRIQEGTTRIGDRNLLMAFAHVGHDCQLGSDITIANACGLSGHVQVDNQAVIGGMTGIHQFVRVGRLSMLGGYSKVSQDVPPFSLYDGNPTAFYGTNTVGLKRAGFDPARRVRIRRALLTLVGSGLSVTRVIEDLQREFAGDPDISQIIEFTRASKRGIARRQGEVDAAGQTEAE